MEGNYSVRLVEERRADKIIWTAEHPDLPGCNATGVDESDAVQNLDRARDAWLATAEKLGMDIPPGHETDAVYTVKISRDWPEDPSTIIGQSSTEDLQFTQDLQFAAGR